MASIAVQPKSKTSLWVLSGIVAALLGGLFLYGLVALFLAFPDFVAHQRAKSHLNTLLGNPNAAPSLQEIIEPPKKLSQGNLAPRINPTVKNVPVPIPAPIIVDFSENGTSMAADEIQQSLAKVHADVQANSNLAQSGSGGQFDDSWDTFKTFRINSNDLKVDETQTAYTLTVPLNQPEDEKNVALKVNPNQVSVRGKTIFRSDSGQQVGSASFMRVFPLRHAVLPNKVSRTVTTNEAGKALLVIELPKQTPSAPEQQASPQKPQASPLPQKFAPGKTLPPDVYRELRKTSPKFI